MLNMNFLWLMSELLKDKVMVEYLRTARLEFLLKKLLIFPQPVPISGFNENKKFPYTFATDEGFPFKPQMTRSHRRQGELNPWETIFNYHLSTARG